MSVRYLVVVALLGLQACAPVSRVILLPDSAGRSTAVQVSNAGGVVDLTQPYQTAALQQDGRLEAGVLSADEVQEKYKGLLALPMPTASQLTLRFEPGTSNLTAESQGQLPEIIALASKRAGGEILVVGHTDRTGSPQANDTLSLQRAQAVRELLVQRGFAPERIEAIGRGEREPVVPTEANVNEPRNRRAEIIIR